MPRGSQRWWVGLLVALAGCRTWSHADVDPVMIDRAADAPCDALVADARDRGVELYISDGGVHFHTLVLAEDETWVLRGQVERIRRGGWLTLRRQRAQEYEARLVCPSQQVERELPVRSCRSGRRLYGIVDPLAIEGFGSLGTPESPCRVSVGVRVGDDWGWWSLDAIVRPSVRAQIEGRR